MRRETLDDGTIVVEGASGVLVGEIKMWPSATAPPGYFACRGGVFSGAANPKLAALLGDTFGTHSGDSYYLPDFAGRVPLGYGTQNPVQQAGWNINIGQKYGSIFMQQHTHAQNAHSHTLYNVGTGGEAVVGSGSALVAAGGNYYAAIGTIYGGAAANTTATNQNAGSGTTENIQPILGINFIIKGD